MGLLLTVEEVHSKTIERRTIMRVEADFKIRFLGEEDQPPIAEIHYDSAGDPKTEVSVYPRELFKQDPRLALLLSKYFVGETVAGNPVALQSARALKFRRDKE